MRFLPNRTARAVCTITALTLAFTGCSAVSATTQPAASHTVDVTVSDTPNQDVVALPGNIEDQISLALAELPVLAGAALDDTGVPGMAIAVVQGDTIVFAEGFGVTEVGTDHAVTADTVFQIASISKSLSATGISAAIQQSDGALSWHTPVKELLPDFRFSDEIVTNLATIGDTFSHRTGLATGAGDDLEDIGFDREVILEQLQYLPLDDFRSSYNYSNFGITVGAEAVANSRHESWQDLMSDLVFTPLHMSST